jgi:hypothetical protein|tara:strand:+ start:1279 stop:1422 length:144 start_codon:yes stop_codon:yes gene_type:complete
MAVIYLSLLIYAPTRPAVSICQGIPENILESDVYGVKGGMRPGNFVL